MCVVGAVGRGDYSLMQPWTTFNSAQPTPASNLDMLEAIRPKAERPCRRAKETNTFTWDQVPTLTSLHKGSFPNPRSLIFLQRFLCVIHSVWFLCVPPPNHLDPIYKPQTAQEFMQGLFWERLEGKCKPDKTEARIRSALIREAGHNYQGEC